MRLLSAILVLGCELPESPLVPTSSLTVEAVLDVASTRQLIMLTWSDQSPESFPQTDVRLILPDGRQLTAVPDGGDYVVVTATTDRLQPGATYGLRVDDGTRVVTGTTTVPSGLLVTSTVPRTFSRRDTLRLSWRRAAGAKAYYVTVQGGYTAAFYSTFADTSIALPGTLETLDGEPLFEAGTGTTVIVSAVDDNFYTYYHAAIDPFAGAPPSRLDGAQGVFGSIVPILMRSLLAQP